MTDISVDNKNINVTQLKYDWALYLMQQGVIVNLSIVRWRGFASLSNEDLGLMSVSDQTAEFTKKYIKLGSHRLLPPDIINEFTHIENLGRKNLERYSFNTIWGRFVPSRAFSEWEDENKKISDLYFHAAVAFRNKYDEIVAQVKSDYRNIARDVWARLHPESKDQPLESFLEEFSSKMISKIPDVHKIVETFKYETQYSIILLPSIIAQNQAKADEIKRNNEIQEFNAKMDRDVKRRISEEYLRRKTELLDGFLQSTVLNLRTYISDFCDEILKSLSQRNRNRDLSMIYFKNIRNMIRKVRLLNFMDDKEIEKILIDLETEISKIKGERNKESIENKLRELLNVSKKELVVKNFNPALGYLEI